MRDANLKAFGLILLVVILLVPGLPAQAQPGVSLPVLDPATLFTDHVEVLEALPILEFDTDAGLLYYLMPGAHVWRVIPLPGKYYSRPGVLRRSDGRYLFGVGYTKYFDQRPVVEKTGVVTSTLWLFDPVAGTFSLPPEQCGVVQALPGEGRWIIHKNPADGQYRMCFTETGQYGAALPETIVATYCPSEYEGLGPYRAALSPDKQHLLILLCRTWEFGRFGHSEAALYGYDIPNNRLTHVGNITLEGDEWLSVEQWAEPTRAVIALHSSRAITNLFDRLPAETLGAGQVRGIFSVDLRAENSLKVFVTQFTINWGEQVVVFVPDPPRFVAYRPGGTDICTRYTFSLATFQVTQHEWPGSDGCDAGISIPDGGGDRLRLVRDGAIPEHGRVVRFSVASETRDTTQVVYSGPIHNLVSVAPGGRYVEIAIGKPPTPYSSQTPAPLTADSPRMAILDLKTGKIVYQAHYYISDPMVAPLLAPVLSWVAGDRFTLRGGTVHEFAAVRLDDGEAVGVPIDYNGQSDPLEGAEFFGRPVFLTPDDGPDALLVAEPNAAKTVPLVRRVSETLRVYAEALDGGHIRITVRMRAEGRDFIVGQWLIRVRKA